MTANPNPADPRDDATGTDTSNSPIDDETTQVPSSEPAATGAAADQPQTAAYSPPPEQHPDWARPSWLEPTPSAPAFSGPPATPPPDSSFQPAMAAPTEPVSGATTSRGGSAGPGRIFAAAPLSAVLASGGTVLGLEGTGALNRPAGSGNTGQLAGQTSHPVTVDDSSAVVAAAANVSPAVVQITATGTSTDVFGGTVPETGVGSGIIFDAAGWILTNRHVVQTQDGSIAAELDVALKDGRTFKGT